MPSLVRLIHFSLKALPWPSLATFLSPTAFSRSATDRPSTASRRASNTRASWLPLAAICLPSASSRISSCSSVSYVTMDRDESRSSALRMSVDLTVGKASDVSIESVLASAWSTSLVRSPEGPAAVAMANGGGEELGWIRSQ